MWVRFWSFLDRCFFGPGSTGPGLGARAIRILRYPYAVIRDLWQGQINLRAMGLVFTTVLSVIPLIAFAFAILKVFGAHRELEPIVYEFFKPVGEETALDFTGRVMMFADRVSSGLVGAVGFALLVWTLLGTIKKVEDSFNFVWRVEVPRSFARRVAEYLSLLIVGPVLLVGFIGLSHAAFRSETVRSVVALAPMQRLSASLVSVSPYVMVTAFFTALYMFIPNTRVRLKSALVGAIVAGIIWAAVGRMFTELVVFSTRLLIVYAGFAVVVGVLLWTYFGWLILLAGAQLSFYIQNPSYLRLGQQELRLSSIELERLALKIMYLVGQAHTVGFKRWTANTLAAELGLPGIAVARVADALESAGLIIVTDRDELVPARDVGRISLHEILQVTRQHKSGYIAPRAATVPAVDRLGARIEASWRECCADRTLRDLLGEDEVKRPAPSLLTLQRSSSPR